MRSRWCSPRTSSLSALYVSIAPELFSFFQPSFNIVSSGDTTMFQEFFLSTVHHCTLQKNPSTFMTPGETCLIRSWKENRNGHASCSFTCLISLTTTQRPGNLHSVVSTYQQHLRQEERHRQEGQPHHPCNNDFSTS